MKYIFTLLFTVLCIGISLGQGQCSQLTKAFKIAEKHYDEGDFENAFNLLDKVLNQKDILSCPIERRKVQTLQTEISLSMNKDSIADLAFRTVLTISPRYKIDTTLNSIDLYYFSQGYRTVPKFSTKLYSGLNNYGFNKLKYFPTPNATNRYSVNIEDTSANIRNADLGFTLVGVQANWHPINLLEVSIGAVYNIKNIDIEKVIGIKTLSLRENQNWVNVPVLAKINLANQNTIPKIIFGLEYSYLINSTLREASNGNIRSDDNKVNINELRNRHHYAFVLGLGLDQASSFSFSKKNKNYYSFEIKYSNQRTALVNAENRYNHPVTLFGLGYIDDDIPIGIHHLELSVGFSFTEHKVQKIKK